MPGISAITAHFTPETIECIQNACDNMAQKITQARNTPDRLLKYQDKVKYALYETSRFVKGESNIIQVSNKTKDVKDKFYLYLNKINKYNSSHQEKYPDIHSLGVTSTINTTLNKLCEVMVHDKTFQLLDDDEIKAYVPANKDFDKVSLYNNAVNLKNLTRSINASGSKVDSVEINDAKQKVKQIEINDKEFINNENGYYPV